MGPRGRPGPGAWRPGHQLAVPGPRRRLAGSRRGGAAGRTAGGGVPALGRKEGAGSAGRRKRTWRLGERDCGTGAESGVPAGAVVRGGLVARSTNWAVWV